MQTKSPKPASWYKDAIIYELHVKAFADESGDGMGDFRGLISKLDYMDDVTTETGIRLALEVAAGRLRKALATSLQKFGERTNRAFRRTG